MAWVEEEISSHHARGAFDCGVPALNEYFAKEARQQHERQTTRTHIAVPSAGATEVLGYYSLAIATVPRAQVPSALTARLGQYDVPFILLGRLAVRHDLRGGGPTGFGAELFVRAAHRAYLASRSVAGTGLIIDAKFEGVVPFYTRYGAIALETNPLRLFIGWSTLMPGFPAN